MTSQSKGGAVAVSHDTAPGLISFNWLARVTDFQKKTNWRKRLQLNARIVPAARIFSPPVAVSSGTGGHEWNPWHRRGSGHQSVVGGEQRADADTLRLSRWYRGAAALPARVRVQPIASLVVGNTGDTKGLCKSRGAFVVASLVRQQRFKQICIALPEYKFTFVSFFSRLYCPVWIISVSSPS